MSENGACTEYNWISTGNLSPDGNALAYINSDGTISVRYEETREYLEPEDEMD